jgi:uncharacterized protein
MEFGDQRPEIDYPCTWEFRVIGSDRDHLMVSIQQIVGNRAHTLADGNRKGSWLSLSLSMTVHDEAERNAIYVALKDITGVKMVL